MNPRAVRCGVARFTKCARARYMAVCVSARDPRQKRVKRSVEVDWARHPGVALYSVFSRKPG